MRTLNDTFRRFEKEIHSALQGIALAIYAQQVMQDPTVRAAIEDAEARIASGEGFPDALPAEEAIALAVAEADRRRAQRSAAS
ncbi:MAG: hypothetical protein ACRDV9_07040 [Acidimicrobiia bacterium]